MTRNHTFNYFRKSKKLRTVDLSEREEEQFSCADAADQLLYKQYHTLALQAINLLPCRRKEVFLLNLNEGLSQQEIADRLKVRSEEHTSELQSLMRISYAVFCLKKTRTPDTKQYIT